MDWWEILILGSVVVLFGVAISLFFGRATEPSAEARTQRKRVLVALGLLAAGALFWLTISRDAELDLPWSWSVSVLLGLLAVLVAVRPRAGGRLLFVSALVAPALALLGMALIYALGSGVSDGAGGTEPFATMAMVSVIASVTAYATPAVVTAALLRDGWT